MPNRDDYCEADPGCESLTWVAWSKRLGQKKWHVLAEFASWRRARAYLSLYCHRRPEFSGVLQRPGEYPGRLPQEGGL